MKKEDLLMILKIEDISELPQKLMDILTKNIEERNKIYAQFLKINNYDLSYDWFQEIYESELSERNQKKQDFTPNSLGQLCSMITGGKGSIHEPTAGNGSMLIADWFNKISQCYPWEYFPSENMVDCWELSKRSIPILLFNLSIRGIMGVVHYGDVLEQDEKCRYLLLNKNNDALAFSDIIIDKGCNAKIVGKYVI